jgi:hypothetical protein
VVFLIAIERAVGFGTENTKVLMELFVELWVLMAGRRVERSWRTRRAGSKKTVLSRLSVRRWNAHDW